VVVGEYDDVVVGYAALHVERLPDGSDLAVIDDIYVEPDAREVGVGDVVMRAVLDWCRARHCRGVDAVALPGNRAIKNFFERFGLTARAIVVHRPLGGDNEQ
jgi:GNAT superfamily N-acetyltransferase